MMKKRWRMMIKIVIIILGMVLLGLLFKKEAARLLPQPEGTYARVQDVMILSQALQEEIIQSEIYQKLAGRYQADAEAILTYEEYLGILAVIGTEQTPQFAARYQPEHRFLQADWNQAFSEMQQFYDPQGNIREVTVAITGMGEAVRDSAGKALPSKQLLARPGRIYAFASDEFQKYNYQTVKARCKGEELLTVTEVLETESTLENVFLLSGEPELLYFYQNYEIRVGGPEEGTDEQDSSEQAVSEKNRFEEGTDRKDLSEQGMPESGISEQSISEQNLAEQIADLHFTAGSLTGITLKKDKINGKLLAVTDTEVTVEGHGTFALPPDLTVYRLYDRLQTAHLRDAAVGYDFTDFILAEGKICAALLARKDAMEYIRVAIGTEDFTGLYHDRLTLSADVDFRITYGAYEDRQSRVFRAGEELLLTPDSEYLKAGDLLLAPTARTGRIALLSLERNQGIPEYRGSMEISKDKAGLLLVNEVLLEEYLYSVVPSEMPSAYPLEALKAQAICARTYAYRYLLQAGLGEVGAHVDDSVGYQVYNNIAENSNTTKAVKETTGKMLYYADAPAGTYYYSTSCGYGTLPDVWKNDRSGDTSYLQATVLGRKADVAPGEMTTEESFAAFIGQVRSGDYEQAEPWYRWQVEIKDLKSKKIEENLKSRYQNNEKLILTLEKGEFVSRPIKKVGNITDIYCEKRLPGGVMDELVIVTAGNTFKVISENAIREVLNDGTAVAVRQDGSEVAMPGLLPSAFMVIATVKEKDIVTGYRLTGGGFGHGVGMSQNGARALGEQGRSGEEILACFYHNCEIKQVY